MTTLTASSQLTDGCDVAIANAIDRLIRISTAVAVLAVASVAAYVSYWHAYAVVRTHGESGLAARLEPATIDGLVYASSMVILYAARHGSPVPRLARWLLGLGIAATLTANMAQGWSHGPVGAAVAAWPAVGLVGSYELLVWLIRTSGTLERGPSAEHLCHGAACSAAVRPFPTSAVDGEHPGGAGSAPQARRGAQRVRLPSSRPSPLEGSVTMRCLRPAPSMTRRWPRTGSACRPAIRCRNAGSLRCSDAHPVAGREREWPMHDKRRRSKAFRTPRSRLNRRPWRHPGERIRRHELSTAVMSLDIRVAARSCDPQVAGVRRSWCSMTLCSVPSPRFREESGVRGEGSASGSPAAWRSSPTTEGNESCAAGSHRRVRLSCSPMCSIPRSIR
jgi:Protein of unknown function (DUF2637)